MRRGGAGRPKRAEEGPPGLRMKDLMRESGLSRETVHFYIAEGLLPPGRKTSRTTAEYSQEHVERLRWIRLAREEQFMPLRAKTGRRDTGDRDVSSPASG